MIMPLDKADEEEGRSLLRGRADEVEPSARATPSQDMPETAEDGSKVAMVQSLESEAERRQRTKVSCKRSVVPAGLLHLHYPLFDIQVFLGDRFPWWFSVVGYIALMVLGTIVIPFLYPKVISGNCEIPYLQCLLDGLLTFCSRSRLDTFNYCR